MNTCLIRMASFFLVSTCVVVCSCVPIGIRLYIVNNGFGESIVVRGSVDAVDCKVSGDCDSRIFPPGSDYGSRIVPTITIHVRNRSEDTVSLDVRMVKLGGTYGKYEFSGACGFDSPYPYTIVRVAPKTEKVAHISYRGKCDSLFSAYVQKTGRNQVKIRGKRGIHSQNSRAEIGRKSYNNTRHTFDS